MWKVVAAIAAAALAGCSVSVERYDPEKDHAGLSQFRPYDRHRTAEGFDCIVESGPGGIQRLTLKVGQQVIATETVVPGRDVGPSYHLYQSRCERSQRS